MAAHRTAYDNFKWIYNLQLDMADAPQLRSQGTVAQPVASFQQSSDGNNLTITISCETPGASIYYSFDGAPQTLYTGPITYDISGRELTSDPVNFYMTAVKEGYDDEGIIATKYPGMAPAFQTLYSSMTGEAVTFTAAQGTSDADWTAWTDKLIGISLKTPSITGYMPLTDAQYTIDNEAKTITFVPELFGESGSYSFLFKAERYANKNVSVMLKAAAPAVQADGPFVFGQPITLTFDDMSYQNGLSIYVTPPEGSATLISATYLDRTQPGQVSIKEEYFSLASGQIKAPGTYELELVNANYAPGSQTVTVTIEAGFADTPQDAWYREAVDYVAENELFNGTSTTTFGPDIPMTRGMFVTVLHRMAGLPEAGEITFTDVPSDEWYTDAVAWAAENGIVGGVEDGTRFAPDVSVRREEIAVILYRYEGEPAIENGTALDAFSDGGEVSSWAEDAMAWAVQEGILKGSGGKLNPQSDATRAEVAQIFFNYCNLNQEGA